MKLSNKMYDVLKWVCLIGIPTFCIAYKSLGLPYGEEVCNVVTAIAALLGAMIGISCINYNKEEIAKEE